MTKTLALVFVLFASAVAAQPALTDRETLDAAIKLLPRTPARVVLIDPDIDVPASVRDKVRTLDGFTLRDDPRIFINVDSELFNAARTSSFYQHALAVVIWHEMAHLDGADEQTAQRAEEKLWQSFIRDERVERVNALRFSKQLVSRRHLR